MRILIIGFSVTEEKDGYTKHLRDLYHAKNRDVTVDVRAIGGTTFNVIPFLIDELIKDKYDYVIYEIATCFRFLKIMTEYDDLLKEISQATLCKAAIPCYINMYRQGVNYDTDMQTVRIEQHAKSNGYPFLDLIKEIIDIQGEKKYLRDGTHTNQDGAALYANKIYDFMEQVFRNEQGRLKKSTSLLVDMLPGEPSDVFTRGEFTTSYISIEQGRTLELVFPNETIICGIVLICGPDSGALSIEFPESGVLRHIDMYDDFCYYRRYVIKMLPEQSSKIVKLHQSDKVPDIKPRKGEYNNQPRIGDVVGFLIKERV